MIAASISLRCIDKIVAMPKSKARDRAVDRTVKTLQARIDQCLHFYPWPALVKSLSNDIHRLLMLERS